MNIIDLKQQPEHLAQLARWHHEEWEHLNPGQSLQDRINNMQDYLNDSFIPSTFVAFYNELLGSAAIVAHDMETRPELTPWLASVYVAPKHRGKGIGKALVSHMMDEAGRHGVDRLYLFTESHVDYYIRLGWSLIEQTSYQGHDVQIMSVEL